MEIRTPEWYVKGYKFLSTVNPKKYKFVTYSSFEGMIKYYELWEINKISQNQIGPIVLYSDVTQEQWWTR